MWDAWHKNILCYNRNYDRNLVIYVIHKAWNFRYGNWKMSNLCLEEFYCDVKTIQYNTKWDNLCCLGAEQET